MSRGRAPALIVIPDPAFARAATVESLAAAALAGGADAIQLRAKGAPDREVVALGRALAGLAAAAGATLYVNDRPDLARACGAGGVHVGAGDAAPEAARALLGPGAAIGVSVYTPADLAAAERAGATYVAVGAVFPTATKRIAVVGLAGLRRWRARTRLPIVAIGGVTAGNAAAAVGSGADGVAVISAVSAAADPARATRELAAAVRAALARRGGGGDTAAHPGGPGEEGRAMEFPAALKYAKEHGWVRAEGGELVFGVSDHAQKELGDVVFVDLPKPGAVVTRGRPYGLVESVKAVSDLVAPASGTVVRANEELVGAPELLNREPYGRGWTVVVAPADPAEAAGLMDADAYRAYLEQIAGEG